jgi:hypothetical protein
MPGLLGVSMRWPLNWRGCCAGRRASSGASLFPAAPARPPSSSSSAAAANSFTRLAARHQARRPSYTHALVVQHSNNGSWQLTPSWTREVPNEVYLGAQACPAPHASGLQAGPTPAATRPVQAPCKCAAHRPALRATQGQTVAPGAPPYCRLRAAISRCPEPL